MRKGDIVRVKARVLVIRSNPVNTVNRRNVVTNNKWEVIHTPENYIQWFTKSLLREVFSRENTFFGLLVGKTYIATGQINADNEYDPAYLQEDIRHPVWKIEPLHQNRYLAEVTAFEEDLEIIKSLVFPLATATTLARNSIEKRAFITRVS